MRPFALPTLAWPDKPDRQGILRRAAKATCAPGLREAHALALETALCSAREMPGPDSWSFALPDMLVHGDNLPLLQALYRGPLGEAVQKVGGLKLVYIDPPFAVGNDFCMPVGPDATREQDDTGSQNEAAPPQARAVAYSDVWENGLCGFLSMMYERLVLIREVLAPEGSLVLHCDRRSAPHLRLLLDEIFGPEHFLGDIVWHYTGGGRAHRWFSRKHDRLLHYAVSDRWTFNQDAVRVPYKPGSGYAKSGITSRAGKKYLPDPRGTPVDDVWDIPMINPLSKERCGYPTQKPLALMERIILALSDPDDLVADFFCGSGSFAVAAAAHGRRWLACDASPLAVAATKGRVLFRAGGRAGFRAGGRTRFGAGVGPEQGAEPGAPSLLLAECPASRPSLDLPPLCRAGAEGSAFSYRLEQIELSLHYAADSRFYVSLQGFAVAAQSKAALPEAVAALLRGPWQNWLAAWSVGLLLPNGANLVLWQSGPEDGAAPGREAQSPLLALPPGADYTPGTVRLVAGLTDIFGNESRILLPLAAPAGTA